VSGRVEAEVVVLVPVAAAVGCLSGSGVGR
jgi:hypothetical protein